MKKWSTNLYKKIDKAKKKENQKVADLCIFTGTAHNLHLAMYEWTPFNMFINENLIVIDGGDSIECNLILSYIESHFIWRRLFHVGFLWQLRMTYWMITVLCSEESMLSFCALSRKRGHNTHVPFRMAKMTVLNMYNGRGFDRVTTLGLCYTQWNYIQLSICNVEEFIGVSNMAKIISRVNAKGFL